MGSSPTSALSMVAEVAGRFAMAGVQNWGWDFSIVWYPVKSERI
ncbi:MAG: hypothetical protein Q7R73_01045 [bacterium]|nr:hypothetical protein [bacterium]